MKKLVFALAALAVALVSCTKGGEQEKDTTPARLLSFQILKADNAFLDKDYSAELIAPTMVIRIPGGGMDKSFTAVVKVGEFDKLYVNGAKVELQDATAKVQFQGKFAVDIEVVNEKSSKSAAYEVKIGKILENKVSKVSSYSEPSTTLKNEVFLAVNPTTNAPYLLYARKSTAEGATDSNNRLACVKYEGKAFANVGTLGFTADSRQAIACDLAFCGETPYVLYYGESAANIPAVRKFDGTEWAFVGGNEWGTKINASTGKPGLFFVSGNPAFVANGNNGKTDPGYRNATVFTFDGTAWSSAAGIAGLPKYGEKGGNDGNFYVGVPTTDDKGNVYVVTSTNLYGYYLFKATNGWEKLVDNFVPVGDKTYGVPSSLSAQVAPDGTVYVLAAIAGKGQYQLYKYDSAQASFTPCGSPIQLTAGGSDTVSETMKIGINPVSGEIIGVYGSTEKELYFASAGKDGQWNEFVKVAEAGVMAATDSFDLVYAADGTAYIATVGATGIDVFKYAQEDDILPE